MVEGRRENQWSHTASLMALLINLHRDPKRGRPADPKDLMPKFGPPKPKPKASIDILRDFVPNCPPPAQSPPSSTA